MNSRLPVLGAALSLQSLRAHRDWLLARQRDLEMQDFFRAEVLDGDWRRGGDIKAALDGYRGRLGIHGPFWGFKIDSHDPLMRAGRDEAHAAGARGAPNHRRDADGDPFALTPPGTTTISTTIPTSRATVDRAGQSTLRRGHSAPRMIGCELVIENIEDKDPHAPRRACESARQQAVRVSLDTGHAQLCAHIHRRAAGRLLRGCSRRHADSRAPAGHRRLCGPSLDAGRGDHPLGARFSARSPG